MGWVIRGSLLLLPYKTWLLYLAKFIHIAYMWDYSGRLGRRNVHFYQFLQEDFLKVLITWSWCELRIFSHCQDLWIFVGSTHSWSSWTSTIFVCVVHRIFLICLSFRMRSRRCGFWYLLSLFGLTVSRRFKFARISYVTILEVIHLSNIWLWLYRVGTAHSMYHWRHIS